MTYSARFRAIVGATLLIAALVTGIARAGVEEHAGDTDRQERRDVGGTQPQAAPADSPRQVLPGSTFIAPGATPDQQEQAARQERDRRQREAEEKKRRHQHRVEQRRDEFVQIATLVFSALSILVTSALGYLAWRQIKVGEKAARAAETAGNAAADQARMLLAQERPLLIIQLTPGDVRHNRIQEVRWPPANACIAILNFGRSPAIARALGTTIAVGKDVLAFSYGRFQGGKKALAHPGGDAVLEWIDTPEIMRQEHVEAFVRREANYTINVHVVTEDVFGNWTLNCALFRLVPDQGNFELLATNNGPLPTDPGDDPALRRLVDMVRPIGTVATAKGRDASRPSETAP